jgi:proline iminopeptidase
MVAELNNGNGVAHIKAMKTLYPEIEPYASYRMPVSGGHVLYLEECGTPRGIPVVFLHGGPGSGCNERHRRYFNPKKYRIVIFDQRGCHRSTPCGSVEHNTTADLLRDMERIRNHLGIKQWLVFGGSWGATLGLLYAQKNPGCVLGLILRGSFLARERDLSWYATDGASRILPEYWQAFIGHLPAKERKDVVAAYHRRIFGGDTRIRNKYARAWSEWATRIVTWNMPAAKPEQSNIRTILNQSRIESHYALNRYFIRDNQIMRNISRIPRVPVTIIHGRRDITCTLEASWSLHKSLLRSELIIVPEAGHLAGEPAMVAALIRATDAMARVLK